MYKLLSIIKPIHEKYKFEVTLYNTETKRTKSIKFGANGMKDYTIYYKEEGKKVADKHKRLYLARHRKREDWTKDGIDTKGFWSRWLLWNKPTIEESIEHLFKKFNLN
jgi:hypothetical protein